MAERLSIGVELGAAAVTLAAVRHGRHGARLEAFGRMPVAAHESPKTVARQLLQQCRLADRPVALSLERSTGLLVVSALPGRPTAKELPQAARALLESSLPVAWSELVCAVRPLAVDHTGTTVQAAVAPAAAVSQRLAQARDAGLSTARVTLEAVAWQALLARLTPRRRHRRPAVVTLDDAGQTGALLLLDEAHEGRRVRAVLPLEAPRRPALSLVSRDEGVSDPLAEQVATALRADDGPQPDAVWIAGPADRVERLAAALAPLLEQPVEPLRPFDAVEVEPARFAPAQLSLWATQAGVALGLALQDEGELDLLPAVTAQPAVPPRAQEEAVSSVWTDPPPARRSAFAPPSTPPLEIEVDIDEAERKPTRRVAASPPWPRAHRVLAGLLALLLVGAGLAGTRWLRARHQATAARAMAEADTRAREEEAQLVAANGRLVARLGQLERLGAGHDTAVQRLEQLRKARPDKLWLERVEHTPAGLQLEGTAARLEEVSLLMRRLREVRELSRCDGALRRRAGEPLTHFALRCPDDGL